MALPSPFFAVNSLQQPQLSSQKPKISKFYRDPQQTAQTKREFISYCKFCKEGFKNDFELNQHRRNHVKCPYDECRFNANESTVAAHVQNVHIKHSGLVKIQDLTTPEQIEKWREERRKRYPTVQNVILRQKLQEEKFKRGERLRESNHKFGDQKQRNFVKNLGKKNHQQQHRHKNSRNHKRNKNKVERGKTNVVTTELNERTEETIDNSFQKDSDSSDEETHHKTPKFTGTSQIKNYQGIEEVVKENSALSMLGLYGSDSDNEEITSQNKTEETEIPENVSNDSLIQSNGCQNFEISINITKNDIIENDENYDADEAPEEFPTLKKPEEEILEEKAEETSASRKRKHHQKDKSNKKVERYNKIPRKSGLDYSRIKRSANPFLEKLLERDIVHERNVLLQCVNFVVKNNFFGVGQKIELSKNDVVNE